MHTQDINITHCPIPIAACILLARSCDGWFRGVWSEVVAVGMGAWCFWPFSPALPPDHTHQDARGGGAHSARGNGKNRLTPVTCIPLAQPCDSWFRGLRAEGMTVMGVGHFCHHSDPCHLLGSYHTPLEKDILRKGTLNSVFDAGTVTKPESVKNTVNLLWQH